MPDILTFLLVALALIVLIAGVRLLRGQSRGKTNHFVRVDFDGYKGKEMYERFVSKER
ncbi:hypothetical protein NNJEOMEG_00818 [Fundidesulfovibrio magnetotacticus]|uniref:Uncharacterized protein n=1 Tax=Fundidesulfovibrio magnetotacticus TaxID=2730080 RepID=A0A6V8LSB2_9BACT|nr:hypothetical protein [Fundidesulfovibrio magnetotacticus]GFK92989.1 hypothetical protein NNJEOMEG_00818 [Fundidesulfovibrio magnetotacticus]